MARDHPTRSAASCTVSPFTRASWSRCRKQTLLCRTGGRDGGFAALWVHFPGLGSTRWDGGLGSNGTELHDTTAVPPPLSPFSFAMSTADLPHDWPALKDLGNARVTLHFIPSGLVAKPTMLGAQNVHISRGTDAWQRRRPHLGTRTGGSCTASSTRSRCRGRACGFAGRRRTGTR